VVVHVFGQTEPGDCRTLDSEVRAVAAGAPDAVADASVDVSCPTPATPEPSRPRGGTAGGGPGLGPPLPDTAIAPRTGHTDVVVAVSVLAASAAVGARTLRGVRPTR
jgi:hypothetical protein